MKKLMLFMLCLLCFCAAFAEAPEPYSFRGMTWDMCPDEVTANESVDLRAVDIGGAATCCLAGSGASIAGYDASIYYLFYSRSLYLAMYDIDDEEAYDSLNSGFASMYGSPGVLDAGTVGDWLESVTGYCPPIYGDELIWHAEDGTSVFLVRYDGGTSLILQAPEDTHGIRQAAVSEKPEWTILIYMCGTDLETDSGYASGNMNAILEAAYSGDIRIVIETGGTKEWQNGIDSGSLNRYVRSGDVLTRVESLPSANMGSVATLNYNGPQKTDHE